MATVHANKILTKFMLLLDGHNHCVKVSSDSETVSGMGLWEFSGALRELMVICKVYGIKAVRLAIIVYVVVLSNSPFYYSPNSSACLLSAFTTEPIIIPAPLMLLLLEL